MALVRTLLMLLGALGVLLIGGLAPASAEAAPQPCHAMAGMSAEGHGKSPDRPMKTMACCVACIATPSITPPVRTVVSARRAVRVMAPRVLPTGQRPSPDTGPPKA